MNKPNHIVLTTIHDPLVLDDLHQNLADHGHLDSTVCWVVGDVSISERCEPRCKRASKLGLETHYLSIADQDKWGRRFPDFYARIPLRNETRRNIGYLHALEYGCERLISIDDDNFPTDVDFISGHAKTGQRWNGLLQKDPSGYFNVCEMLEFSPNRTVFPRGFPFQLRNTENAPQSIRADYDATIGITAGLWLGDPDIDATTWLNGRVAATSLNEQGNLVLDQSTWSPINTQNTSVVRDLIPAFFTIPMGFSLPGGTIGRYGDIWGGYFAQALMQNTPYVVSFGEPLVEHRRNPHDYLNDLRHEYWDMILTDWLLAQLRSTYKPVSNLLTERIGELADFLFRLAQNELPDWYPEEAASFLQETSRTMHLWAGVCAQVIGSTIPREYLDTKLSSRHTSYTRISSSEVRANV